MKKILILLSLIVLVAFIANPLSAQTKDILSPEEVYWLNSRNNTIVVYPEKNFPPFSYENSSKIPQGLSIDFIELIAEKLGIKVEYLNAKPLAQILDDVKASKGDVITSLAENDQRSEFLYFTDHYISVPAVIVVRKDYNGPDLKNLSDLTGKKVSIGDEYAVESFVRVNNPRIIIESATDDEISLQRLVLGDVNAAIMDVASLSFYLSKQVLSSVKVSGNTGFEYRLSFAVSKEKQILQSILDKGLSQIAQSDRELISNKWVTLPQENKNHESLIAHIQNNISLTSLFILFGVGIIGIITLLFRRKNYPTEYFKTSKESNTVSDMSSLEKSNKMIAEELRAIKEEEERLAKKLDSINTSQKVNNISQNEKETLKESSSIE